MALQLGGEMTELDGACHDVREAASPADARDEPSLRAHWIADWRDLGEPVAARWTRPPEARAAIRGCSPCAHAVDHIADWGADVFDTGIART